jgi:hypothetical protein
MDTTIQTFEFQATGHSLPHRRLIEFIISCLLCLAVLAVYRFWKKISN